MVHVHIKKVRSVVTIINFAPSVCFILANGFPNVSARVRSEMIICQNLWSNQHVLLQEYALFNSFVDKQAPAVDFTGSDEQASTKGKLQRTSNARTRLKCCRHSIMCARTNKHIPESRNFCNHNPNPKATAAAFAQCPVSARIQQMHECHNGTRQDRIHGRLAHTGRGQFYTRCCSRYMLHDKKDACDDRRIEDDVGSRTRSCILAIVSGS